MNSVFYKDSRVSGAALNRFLRHFKPGGDELHTFALYDNDTCMIRLAPAPYNPSDKREIYSLSKSFCSTAIGLLYDDGKLDLDERIVDIFPEDCPEVISENLAEMRVRNVLSMNTGHSECAMTAMSSAENPVKAFLAQPVVFKPGTHFTYNTGATCLLSCIVEKYTGGSLLDFLTARLFVPLGIEGVRWNCVNAGQNEGGCGMHISCDDIVKLGLLYLHKGVWNGKRILSQSWVEQATCRVSDNGTNGSSDWCAGYGFQFWMNCRGGYRGDGAFGQLCYVLPERGIVAAVQAEVVSMQAEIDALTELVNRLYDADENPAVVLPDYAPVGSACAVSGAEDKLWKLAPNPIGWTTLRLHYCTEEAAMHILFSDGCEEQTIRAGSGEWLESTIIAKMFKPKLTGLMQASRREPCRFMASYISEEGSILVRLRYLNSPHNMELRFTVQENSIRIEITPAERLYPGASVLTGTKV